MSRKDFYVTLAIVAAVSFAAAAAFSAYLKPEMLIEFANMVLCT